MKVCYLDVETWDFMGNPYTKRVRLGKRITNLVEDMFCYGQCHGLALAINELTGWPLFGIYRPKGYGGSYTRHVVASSSRHGLVDISGKYKLDGDEALRTVKDPAVLLKKRPGWLVPNMEFARHYAPIVLEKMHA